MPAAHSLARRSAVALVALLAVAGVCFRDVLAGRLLFVLDVHQTFVPLREGLAAAWHRGLPLWDPRLGNGIPLPANPLEAAWYPPNLLFAMGEAPLVYTWLTVAHVLLGAFGAWALARRLGMSRSAAWVAAVVFGFNGVALSSTAFANLAWSAAWLPWLLERWSALAAGRRPLRPACGVAVVFAMMLSIAEPFVLLAGLAALGAMSAEAWSTAGADDRRSRRRRLLAIPAAALGGGALLAAPFLLAVLRYLPASVRSLGYPPEATMYWSAHPLLGLGMLLPGVFGEARLDGLARFWATALSPEKGFPLLVDPYLGAVALALALLAATSGPRRQRIWLAWGALLVLLALGRHGPLYPLLAGVPPLNSLRFPIKWLVPATLPLALLSAAGVDLLRRDQAIWRRLALIVALLLVSCAAVAQLALPALEPWLDRLLLPVDAVTTVDDDARAIARAAVLAGTRRGAFWLAATLGVCWFAASSGAAARRRTALVVLALLVAGDLAWRAPNAMPSAPASLYRVRSPLAEAILADAGRHDRPRGGRAYIEAPPYVELTLSPVPANALDRARLQRAGLFGYTGASQGLELAFNPDVGQMRPIHYARLGSMVRQAPAREKAMLLGAAGVSHVASYDRLDDSDLQPLGSFALGATRPVQLYRNERVVPRVRVVRRVKRYSGDAAFIAAVIEGARTLFEESTLIEQAEWQRAGYGEPPPPGDARASSGGLHIVRDTPSRLTVRTDGPGGWLVVADCWVPGWRAIVDGRPVPLLRADYAFRAVRVPAGAHSVELRYRPW